MKHLLEIAQLITRKKGRKIEVFEEGPLSSKNSKFNEFYEALLAGRYKNDRDAATHLYGCSPTDDRYRQLKSRFRRRLLNTLFFLDQNQPAGNNYERAYYSCNKDWALVKILLANDAPNTAIDLARGLLNTALKYRFADLVLSSARILRDHAARHGTEAEFEECHALVREYAGIQAAEIRADEVCQRVALLRRTPPPETRQTDLRAEISSSCAEVEALCEQFKSPGIFFNFLLLQTCMSELDQDWQGLVAICRQAEEYIAQQPHFHQGEKMERLRLKKIGAYLHLRDFDRGIQEAENLVQAATEGGETWFAALDGYFLLAMHAGRFAEARRTHERATQHPKFRKMPAADRERWHLYETYLEIFSQENGANGHTPKLSTRNGKPLHEPLAFARDNRLFALHHSVVQVVTALAQNNYIGAAGHIDRLKNLANRQFKSAEPDRTQQFIRLLQHLAKAGFDAHHLNGAKQAYEDLTRMPFHYRGVVQDLEVVPYEKLWQAILDNLDN